MAQLAKWTEFLCPFSAGGKTMSGTSLMNFLSLCLRPNFCVFNSISGRKEMTQKPQMCQPFFSYILPRMMLRILGCYQPSLPTATFPRLLRIREECPQKPAGILRDLGINLRKRWQYQ